MLAVAFASIVATRCSRCDETDAAPRSTAAIHVSLAGSREAYVTGDVVILRTTFTNLTNEEIGDIQIDEVSVPYLAVSPDGMVNLRELHLFGYAKPRPTPLPPGGQLTDFCTFQLTQAGPWTFYRVHREWSPLFDCGSLPESLGAEFSVPSMWAVSDPLVIQAVGEAPPGLAVKLPSPLQAPGAYKMHGGEEEILRALSEFPPESQYRNIRHYELRQPPYHGDMDIQAQRLKDAISWTRTLSGVERDYFFNALLANAHVVMESWPDSEVRRDVRGQLSAAALAEFARMNRSPMSLQFLESNR